MLLEFYLNLYRTRGDFAEYSVGGRTAFLLNHPDYLKHIFAENKDNYTKKVPDWQTASRLLTESGARIFNLLGRPSEARSLAAFRAVNNHISQRLETHIEKYIERGETVTDMLPVIHEAVITALSSVFFDYDLSAEVLEFLAAAFDIDESKMLRRMAYREGDASEIEKTERQLEERRQRGRDFMLLVAGHIIRERVAAQGLTELPEKERLNMEEAVIMMLLLGYESFANALCWALYQLALHPQEQEIIRDEVAQIMSGAAADELPFYSYSNMAVREALRINSPAWMTSREAKDDDIIAGRTVPAGSLVTICSYTLHRNTNFWMNPEVFDPSRFHPTIERSQWTYAPFGAGPRKCVASAFALKQLELIVARLASRYDFNLEPGHTVTPYPLTSLRPHPGLNIHFSRVN
ncbi:MAG: cytochrome P450 [Acidobacteria bacterium]|nr:cytochrome P450 [Acidobacteriota bacterium]